MFSQTRQLCVGCACSPTASTVKRPPSLCLVSAARHDIRGAEWSVTQRSLRTCRLRWQRKEKGNRRDWGCCSAVWHLILWKTVLVHRCSNRLPQQRLLPPPTAITSTLNLLLTAFTQADIQHLSPRVRTHWLTHTREGSEFDSPSSYVKSVSVCVLWPSTLFFLAFLCK